MDIVAMVFNITTFYCRNTGARSWRAKLTQTMTILIKSHHKFCHKASWHLSSNERARGMFFSQQAIGRATCATESVPQRVQSQRVAQLVIKINVLKTKWTGYI
jgi:hypothetical protein